MGVGIYNESVFKWNLLIEMRKDPTESTSALLRYYSFDLGNYSAEQIVKELMKNYPTKWVVAAVIESIYQGRYKITSINNILLNWHLNGHPQHHFDVEFADLICSNLSSKAAEKSKAALDSRQKKQTVLPDQSEHIALNILEQEEETESEKTNSNIGNRGEIPNSGIDRWLKLIRKLS
jgi:hypothetical protein